MMNSSLVSVACRHVPRGITILNGSVIHRTTARAAPLASAPVTPESLINEQRPQSKESKEHEKTQEQRLSAKVEKKAKVSNSFVLNLFRGQFHSNDIFPYPNVLNEEQRENVKMLIDPIWKFFEEKNDAAKNDQLEKVRNDSLAFGDNSNRSLSSFVDSR